MDTGALKLLGIEPELGTEITLTYTVGDKNQISYDKTDTFTLAGWWDYDDISPVHFVNVSEEYARSVEAEGMAAGMNPFRTDLNVMMASSLDIRAPSRSTVVQATANTLPAKRFVSAPLCRPV